jgi:sec-independent protein translocase protein TatA
VIGSCNRRTTKNRGWVDVFNLGAPELLILFAIVLLLFGSARLPKLAKSLGEARRELQVARDEDTGA